MVRGRGAEHSTLAKKLGGPPDLTSLACFVRTKGIKDTTAAGSLKAKRGTGVEAVAAGGSEGTRRQKEEGPCGTLPSSMLSAACTIVAKSATHPGWSAVSSYD